MYSIRDALSAVAKGYSFKGISVSHGGDYEYDRFPGCRAVQFRRH